LNNLVAEIDPESGMAYDYIVEEKAVEIAGI
jgi:hypothetical protein